MQNIQAASSSELPKDIQSLIDKSKNESKSIVLVTGVFDVLHFEHENFLRKSKKLGGILLIAIESDFRVKKIKGEGRPVNSQQDRANKIRSLGISKHVFILPDEFGNSKNHIKLIKTIKPDILAVSSHTPHLDKKQEIMDMVDGKLVAIHQQNPKVSSTKIINGKVR